MQPIRAVELLIEKIKRDYPDDVSVVVVMGSALYGDTHSRSDIDMYFVPKTERAKALCFTFIIDGIGFDFWGISWERLARIAGREERIASIITEGSPLYFGSEEDKARFEALRKKALDVGNTGAFIKKADAKLDEAYRDYFKLSAAQTLSGARKGALYLIYDITDALALLNRMPVKRGRKRLKAEILAMPLVPENFSSLYDTVFDSNDIEEMRCAYGELLANTQALVDREAQKASPPHAFGEAMDGFYEELINCYNKIYRACETGDPVTALFAAVEMAHEIEQGFCGTGVSPAALPDLVDAYDPDGLPAFAAAAREHQLCFEALLDEQAVPVRTFADFDALEKYLATL